MIDQIVTKIKSIVEGISYPAYTCLYTTLLKANVELGKFKYDKVALLIDWTDIQGIPIVGNGIFPKPEFTLLFAKRMKLSETTEKMRPAFVELETDILTFLQHCEADKDVSLIEITGLSKSSDLNDENLIGYSLKFKISLVAGVSLNNCD